ncbi:MAG: DegT/DnrJ/EryC1/StrS family aminotransferase, partial [Verrucomicrobia bacterium]|nr:DegT/DnrJ/EryC1/StrS family aminotransferase [Verrucomicrobiota bacterium]
VDIESRTFNLSPERLENFLVEECEQKEGGLQTKSGLRVKAVIPVHLFGLCCAMEEILSLSSRFGFPVIEDAAQAIGAKYPLAGSTTSAGCQGDFAFFSFYPTKNLGAFGDAGLAVTRHQTIFQKMLALRNHGMEKKYQHRYLGGNFRLDELQAAVLLKKMRFLPQWSRRRWEIAQRYRSNLEDLNREICLPSEPFVEKLGSQGHIYNQYVIRTERRNELRDYLGNQGVGTEIYYPVPLHQQECFRSFRKQHLPEAERAAREVVALPVFPELTDKELDIVCERVRRFFKK